MTPITTATRPAPAGPIPSVPALSFDVPAPIAAQLAAARTRGASDVATWLAANPTAGLGAFRSFVVERVGAPPAGAAQAADLAAVQDAARGRDELRSTQARWVDEHGLFEPWAAEEAAYVAAAGGASQAAAGLALLTTAGDLSTDITFAVKDAHLRERPFALDPVRAPLLDGISHTRGGSFPSGHASTAYVKAAVLDALLPERAATHARLADQIAFARTYAAAHFPTDIATGAYIGSAAAAYVRARPDTTLPPRRTHP